SASSLLGIFLSPLLVGLVMNIHGAQGSLEEVGKIMLQLLLPLQAGATTVAITHNLGSPLCEEADFCLINGNRQGMLQGDSIGTK
ncbi:bile acid:sodium symporter, partial [Salmonella enterica subsp. enterica serovar Virginia]|nr:bile acid:sodium symporter [Salmonella enterica subsp. enterica serovar Virginia]